MKRNSFKIRISAALTAFITAVNFAAPAFTDINVPGQLITYAAEQGSVNTDRLNVRSGPGTSYGKVATLGAGTKVTVNSETTGNDGYKWYSISFTGGSGYARYDYITKNATYAVQSADFESYLNAQGFPESYKNAYTILRLLDSDSSSIGTDMLKQKIDNADKGELLKASGLDQYTFNDILDAFKEPLRDIRDNYDSVELRSDIKHLEDLKIGDELMGTVRNVVDFGAFVDCGVKYDGLVHLSKMSKKYIKHPSELLSVGDKVKVYVCGIDLEHHKLSLTMIKGNE